MITCPKCQFQNRDEHHFCISCGTTIKILDNADPVSREEFNTLRSHVDSLRQALISRGIKLEESRQEKIPKTTSQKMVNQRERPKRINLNIEKIAGINWLAIIGSIAVVLGIGRRLATSDNDFHGLVDAPVIWDTQLVEGEIQTIFTQGPAFNISSIQSGSIKGNWKFDDSGDILTDEEGNSNGDNTSTIQTGI